MSIWAEEQTWCREGDHGREAIAGEPGGDGGLWAQATTSTVIFSQGHSDRYVGKR